MSYVGKLYSYFTLSDLSFANSKYVYNNNACIHVIIILVYSVMTENISANVVTQGEQICAYFKSGGKEQNIS